MKGKASEEVISLSVNGKMHHLIVGKDIQQEDSLSHTIRETIGLTGTKIGCDHAACGACTVLMSGKPVLSCSMLTVECDGADITTIEGLVDPKTGKLHPVQEAFINHTAFQCGFCTPGIILSVKALLDENPSPSEAEVRHALSGHYCRCISNYAVIKAVMDVVSRMKVESNG